jgi:hypothetical protein
MPFRRASQGSEGPPLRARGRAEPFSKSHQRLQRIESKLNGRGWHSQVIVRPQDRSPDAFSGRPVAWRFCLQSGGGERQAFLTATWTLEGCGLGNSLPISPLNRDVGNLHAMEKRLIRINLGTLLAGHLSGAVKTPVAFSRHLDHCKSRMPPLVGGGRLNRAKNERDRPGRLSSSYGIRIIGVRMLAPNRASPAWLHGPAGVQRPLIWRSKGAVRRRSRGLSCAPSTPIGMSRQRRVRLFERNKGSQKLKMVP